MTTYAQLLRDPRWQRKRLEILQRDNFTCQECKAIDKTLHVHHCFYEANLLPWEYPPHSMITLCEPCHADVSEYKAIWFTDNTLPVLMMLTGLGLTPINLEKLAYHIIKWHESNRDNPRKILDILCAALHVNSEEECDTCHA